MYYAMSIVEYISFCTSDIWNVQVNNNISFGIDEFYHSIVIYGSQTAENGGYPPTQNGDIRSLFWLFSLMALQN